MTRHGGRPHRVAVTTSVGSSADRWSAVISGTGLHPVALPCIEIVDAPEETLDRLRAEAQLADWIVVTSARAVAAVWPDGPMPARPLVAAVGPTTADAVRSRRGRIDLVGTGGAAALRDTLLPRIEGSTVVFPHARDADPQTEEILREHAARMVSAPAYTTVPVAPGDDTVDAAIFGSPSAVTGWTSSRSLTDIVTAAMGSTTEDALQQAGVGADVVPERPGIEDTVTVLGAFLSLRLGVSP